MAVVTMVSAAERRFLASCAIVFVGSAAVTVYACQSMPDGMRMPGGWTMSMSLRWDESIGTG